MGMTEVETLLSVDAGRVPPDTLVFVAADPDAPARRAYAFLSGTAVMGALGCLLAGTSIHAVVLMGLIAAILLVLAWPPSPEPDEARNKRATLVVTPTGMIVRDDGGLRTWRFEDLSGVHPYGYGEGLCLIRRDGKREFLDCLMFSRGERLVEVIGRRLRTLAS